MLRKASLSAALMPLAILAGPVFAQDQTTIVVTGEGLGETPAATAYDTQVIEREEIVSSSSGRIEDVLGNIAGFQQFRRSDSRSSNPTAQGVTLRALGGNASSRALVTLDGVPLTDPFFGYVPLSALAPERLGQVRVTRGGGSGSFGAGALAGRIELNSAGPDTLNPVQASALVNVRGETELYGGVTPRIGEGFLSVSGRWDRGSGFFTAPRDQRVPASARAAFDSWSAAARLVQPVASDVELQARVLAFEDERTLRFDGADSRIEGQDASLRLVGRGEWEFDVLVYGQWRDFSNVVISSTSFVPVLDQKETPATGFGGKTELRPPVGPDHTLRLGVDMRRVEGEIAEDRISSFTGNVFGQRFSGGQNRNLGLFIEDDWQIGDVVLTGGLRADRIWIEDGFFTDLDGAGAVIVDDRFATRKDWEVSWRGGAVWQANEQLALRAVAYRGLRLPTLNELYRPFVVFPIVTQANAQLEPEILEGFEAGFDWRMDESIAVSLTAFDNRVENAIANVTIGTNLRQRQNLPAIDAQGIEADLDLALDEWSFGASLAYTNASIDGIGVSDSLGDSLDGLRPPQTPRFAASATLAYQPQGGMRAALTLRHVSKQFEDDSEGDVLPAATTFDAFVQIPLGGGFAAVLRGENLLDEQIVTRNSGGSIDLGVPRTLWAGLRYGF